MEVAGGKAKVIGSLRFTRRPYDPLRPRLGTCYLSDGRPSAALTDVRLYVEGLGPGGSPDTPGCPALSPLLARAWLYQWRSRPLQVAARQIAVESAVSRIYPEICPRCGCSPWCSDSRIRPPSLGISAMAPSTPLFAASRHSGSCADSMVSFD